MTKRGGNVRKDDIRDHAHPTKHRRLNELKAEEAQKQIKDYTTNKDY